MKARYQSSASVAAWQKVSSRTENLTRLIRGALSIPLWLSQLPLIALDVAAGTTFFGRPSWNFSFRALRLLGAYVIWSLNPGTRPLDDVLSKDARQQIGKLKKGHHAALVEVPPCFEKAYGDAVHDTVTPEPCPCFWQWLSSMPSPLAGSTPVSERTVMLYFVGGGMVQGHPISSPLPWKIMEVSKVPVFGVNFRKCVTRKTAFPAALQDAISAFFFLLGEGYLPENISIMGDSGGGGIVLTFLLYIGRYNMPIPGAAILISPFVSLVDTFAANTELLNLDFLNPEMCSMVSFQYTENRPDLRGTLLSPSENKLPEGYTFSMFPRTLITYGDAEMFAPGIIQLVGHLQAAGVHVEVVVGKDHIHDYPNYTKDRSANGFFGRLRPFLDSKGGYGNEGE